jgi:hypothetical protein
LFLGIVDPVNHKPLKHDTALRLRNVLLDCREQGIQGIPAVDGYQAVAENVCGGVKRDCQFDGDAFFRHSLNLVCYANSAQGDAAGSQPHLALIDHVSDGGHRLLIVEQGFSHPHQDDVGEPYSLTRQFTLNVKGLGDDFVAVKLAHESHLSCGAKNASTGAADLGGNAGTASLTVAQKDDLYLFAVS